MKKKLLTWLTAGLFVFGVVGISNATSYVIDPVAGFSIFGTHYSGENLDLDDFSITLLQDSVMDLISVGDTFNPFTMDTDLYLDGGLLAWGTEILYQPPTSPTPYYASLSNLALTAGTHVFTFDYTGTVNNYVGVNFSGVNPVPEPATMLLFGTGLLGLAGVSFRRKRR